MIRAKRVSRIFISYRWTDAAEHVSHLHASLQEHYDRADVFLDIVSIEPGSEFTRRVDQAVRDCDVLLLIVGQHFMAAANRDTATGLDFVHAELRAALDRGIRVVPVLMNGVDIPPSHSWPLDLVSITRRNAFRISEENWDECVRHLAEALERMPPELRPGESLLDYHDPIVIPENSLRLIPQHFANPSIAIPDIARLVAQWFRSQGLAAQVLYRNSYTAVQCTDGIGMWRGVYRTPRELSVIISRVSDSLVVRTTPGAWVDQFLPEGAAPKRQFFTDEATKRFFIIAPTLLLAGKSAFWPATFATEVIAWGVIGKKRKALITRTEKFVTEVIQGGESHFLSDRRML